MADLRIIPSSLSGSLRIPSSKSQTLRAILFASIASGRSTIEHPLASPDTSAMIGAVRQLGAIVEERACALEIQGTGGVFSPPSSPIDCGNSGLVLRLIAGLGALCPFTTTLVGDASISQNRRMEALLSGLSQLGAEAISLRGNGLAPVSVRGPLRGGRALVEGGDSQPISALLIASALAPASTEIVVSNPGEKPWIDLTLDWLRRSGVVFSREGYTRYWVKGESKLTPFHYSVPGDFSTAAFPIGAALVTGSPLELHNLDWDDLQGDKALIEVLQQMGAKISVIASEKKIEIASDSRLHGINIDVNPIIDALPLLAVLGCFAEGTTELFNGAVARYKESNRIGVIVEELRKMGARIEERSEGLKVETSRLHGSRDLQSHGDHRIAMALTVAALFAEGESRIRGCECVAKTYPGFVKDFRTLGANTIYQK